MRPMRVAFNLLVALISITLISHAYISFTHTSIHAVTARSGAGTQRGSQLVLLPGMQVGVEEGDPGFKVDSEGSQRDGEDVEDEIAALPRLESRRHRPTEQQAEPVRASHRRDGSPPPPQTASRTGGRKTGSVRSESEVAQDHKAETHAPAAACEDEGPWPCHEEGCPGPSVSCKDMVDQCNWEFGKLFIHPPSRDLAKVRISSRCRLTCGICSSASVAGPAAQSRGDPQDSTNAANGLEACGDGGGKKDSSACKGGRGVWGAIWKDAPPTGENLNYHAPTSYAGYAAMVDSSSFQNKSKPVNGCSRFFKVGERGDMRQTVKPMFKELGLCEAPEDSMADMMWTRPWEVIPAFFRAKVIHPGAIVNSIGGLPQQVGQKTSLARLHVSCMKRNGYDPLDAIPKGAPFCRFTQRAFAIRRAQDRLQMPYRRFQQYTQQLDAEMPEEHRIWILKPQGGFNQIGIHMYSMSKEDASTEEGVLQWMMQRVPEGTWVLQEYLMNPMTYNGHKFDLRIWAVVTSLDPLRLHLLKTGIPKVSQWKYSKDAKDVKEQCIHVLMPGTLECFTDVRAEVLQPYPTRTDVPEWWAAMSPRGEKFWKQKAWPSIEFKLVELMLLARDPILHIDHSIKRKGLQYKRIFFLQPDIVVDKDGVAYMVEVNTNGYMIGNLHKDFFPLFEEQRGLMRTIGANGFPQAPKYMKALKAQTQIFCKKADCGRAFEREIWEAVHEDMHATQGWYRIFPTTDAREYTATLKQAPQYAKSFTILDRLMFSWLDRKWMPKHTHDSNGTVLVLEQKL